MHACIRTSQFIYFEFVKYHDRTAKVIARDFIHSQHAGLFVFFRVFCSQGWGSLVAASFFGVGDLGHAIWAKLGLETVA